MSRKNTTYYVSDDGDAVIAITKRGDTWRIGDHMAKNPGKQQGKRLREKLLKSLLPIADAQGVTIKTVAAHPKLLEMYQNEIPGLERQGRAFPRGHKMLRKPVTANQKPSHSNSSHP